MTLIIKQFLKELIALIACTSRMITGKCNILVLPAQFPALQFLVSLLAPTQSAPPFAGAGFVQVLDLV